jgi:trigger factor
MSEASATESMLLVDTTEDTPVVRTVSVEVPADRVRASFEKAYRKLARTAQVKGFRRGKAPRKVLERVYGAAAAGEVERALITETLPAALTEAAVQPVTEPEIDAQPAVPDGPFRYSARVEVKPAIELPELEGLPGKQPKVEIDESQIEAQLEALRRQSAPLVEVPDGQAASDGDTVDVDFEGRIDGELFEGGSAAGLPIELGSGRMIPGFEEQLIGVVAGETRELAITFPDDYGSEALRGKDATFAVTVGAIKRLELAELDDEFAVDVGEDSLEALRDKLRKQLDERAGQQSKSALHRSLMEVLVERSDFEVPPGLVERQLHSQMKSMQQQFAGQVDDETLQSELARIHETGRAGAERRVRESLLLDAIVRDQGLVVEQAAVDARLDEIAAAQGTDSATLRKIAEAQGWRQSIEAELLDSAALDFLVSRASVEETTDT